MPKGYSFGAKKNYFFFLLHETIPIAIRYNIPPTFGIITLRLNHPGCFSFSKILHIAMIDNTVRTIHPKTGINIKNLHYIVFAGGGKAKVKIVQSIGRGLRLHKDKSRLIIIDIADQLYYGYRHMTKRISLYSKEKIKYGIKKITETKTKT